MVIRIEKIVYPGRRLGLLGGKVIFTDHGLPGETVDVEVLKDRRSYAEGRTVRIVGASPARTEPRCAHYLACSPYQDMDYALEVEIKKAQITEILTRELKMRFGPIRLKPSPEIWGYRNKVGLRVRREGGRAEFYYHQRHERDEFVAVDRCYLLPERMNELMAGLLEAINRGPLETVEGVEIRMSRAAGRSLILCELASDAEKDAVAGALKGLQRKFALAGAVAAIKTNGRSKDETLIGREFVEEKAGGLTFRIGARSFFQINLSILEGVFEDVALAAGLIRDRVVADLYCGLGTFGMYLAGRAREVFGVEPDADNLAYLKKNLEINDVHNFAVCEGTAEEWLPEILERDPAAVILDPPRRGIEPATLEGLVADPVPRIVYLSCNPTTLARDLKAFLPAYEITDVRAYDFFPHTPHIEALAILDRREPAIVAL